MKKTILAVRSKQFTIAAVRTYENATVDQCTQEQYMERLYEGFAQMGSDIDMRVVKYVDLYNSITVH